MSTGTTPSLGLLLGDDALENDNWQKLDRVYRALFREIIPDNVVIQGDLEVTGSTKLDGTLEVVGQATFDGAVTMPDLAIVNSLLVENGPIQLPPGSLQGPTLAPGASVYTAQTGTAQTGQLTLTSTYQDLGDIILSPPDDPNRWELVIASLQLQVGMGADQVAGVTQNASFRLKRGQTTTSVVQQRNANYTLTRAGYFEIPITMVRVAKPVNTADGISRWAIEGLIVQALPAPSVTRMFTQLSVIQFA